MRSLHFMLLVLFASPVAAAEPVQVEVGVLANGAKFIGDKTGGTAVKIIDAESGEVVAEGVTRGGTGDTARIMQGERYASLRSESDAVFAFSLPLDEPAQFIVEAEGPLGEPQATSRARKSVWLIPDMDRVGDSRVLLSLSGYIIRPLDVKLDDEGRGHIRVELEMLCGCPIQPGGTWNADRIHKQAVLVMADGEERTADLEYTGKGATYEVRFEEPAGEIAQARVDAVGMDDDNATSLVLQIR